MGTHVVDYGNWVSRKLVIVPAILGLGCAIAATWSWWLLLPTGVFLLASAYFTYARWAFSPAGCGIQNRMLGLLLSRLSAIDEEATVLDIGCGSGALAIRIAREHPNVRTLGIDTWGSNWGFSKGCSESNAQAEGVADRVSFEEGDAVSLPFDDGSFDVVVSNFVFHEIHRVKDKRQLLREALRVLKPGGIYVIQDLFLWRRVYGPIEDLIEAVQGWGIEAVEFVDTSQSEFVPTVLKLPFMVGTAGILYGRK
jgi:SAM-dependent methyltransferase